MSLECGYCERDLRGGHAEDCLRGTPEQFALGVRRLGGDGIKSFAVGLGLKTNCKSRTRIIGDVARKLHGKDGNKYLAACFENL